MKSGIKLKQPGCGCCEKDCNGNSPKAVNAIAGKNEIVVALAGQPNTGKSTIFNRLTGLRQRVGNWPGKTVSRREGFAEREDRVYRIVDLPGAYGLSAHSLEEEIARDYIVSGKPDVMVVVVNAAALERGLYLVSELAALDLPVVIALNMMDVAEDEGRKIDHRKLSEAAGMPVVPMTASRNQGVKKLLTALDSFGPADFTPAKSRPETIAEIAELIPLINPAASFPWPAAWTASKLFEGDGTVTRIVLSSMDEGRLQKSVKTFLADHTDSASAIVHSRQQWIDTVCHGAVSDITGDANLTTRLDRWLLHPVWGRITAFLAVPLTVAIVFGLTMLAMGVTLMVVFEKGPFIKEAWPGMLGSLVADGILLGLGWVAALSIAIGIIYTLFHFLEDVGYLARISYLTDSLLRRAGTSGKAAIPLLMGLACNTIAIAGTRVVDTRRQRLAAIFMLPFLPCGGQSMVAALFVLAFFPPITATVIIVTITLANILAAVLAGKTVAHFTPRPEADGLILELPLYHRPNFRTIFSGVRTRVVMFVRRAGSVIFCAVILVWAVSYFPNGDVHTSFLYQFGRLLEPAGKMVGLDWRFMVALLSSFIAKETTAGTLAVLFSLSSPDSHDIIKTIGESITLPAALAFVVASHFYVPCLATVAMLRSEIGSVKWTVVLLAVMLTLAFFLAFITYQIASLML